MTELAEVSGRPRLRKSQDDRACGIVRATETTVQSGPSVQPGQQDGWTIGTTETIETIEKIEKAEI